MTQSELILRHIEEKGSITPLEALNEYGCFRLASRINEIRRTVNIETLTVKNNGKSYAKYVLAV